MPKLDFSKMPPRKVEAYLKEKVRELFGDETENAAGIYSQHGYFTVYFDLPEKGRVVFETFRKKETPKIVAAMKALSE